MAWTSAGTGTPPAGPPAPDDHREDPGSDDREHRCGPARTARRSRWRCGPAPSCGPAARTIELHTADGLTLVGELALPPDRDPVATLVTLHPLPTHGGFMDSHVLRRRPTGCPPWPTSPCCGSTPGVRRSPRGTSEGAFDEARSERFDVAAAIEFAEFHDLPHRWLLGWSFGTDLALMHGRDPAVEGAILLSPPLRFSRPSTCRLGRVGKPLVALVPEHDDYLQPAEAAQRFAAVPQAEVVGVEGGRTCGWGRRSSAGRWTRSSPWSRPVARRCRAPCRRPCVEPDAGA